VSGWRTVSLADVAAIERSVIEPCAIKSGTPYVGLENIQSGGTFVGVRPVNNGQLASSKFAFTARHVLYGKLRPYLAKIGRPDFGGICSTDILPILPGPALDRNYIAHFLLTPEMVAFAASRATGANLPRLSPRAVAELRLPLPPMSEQRRIADILDKAEALRAKRRAALALLDALTQSIFVDMFGSLAANPHRWPMVRLRDLCEMVIDCPHSTPAYSAQRTPYPCVRSSDIQNAELSFCDVRYVDRREYDRRIARGRPQRGDVVYCREGARFGNAARVVDDTSLCLGQRMMLFRPAMNAAVAEYIWAFLSNHVAYRQAQRTVGGSASPHVNVREIAAFSVPSPPLDLQHRFAARVAAVDGLKAAHRASLASADVLFRSLQHRAFRGEL
jgi:type I restriction enzyme S subunit